MSSYISYLFGSLGKSGFGSSSTADEIATKYGDTLNNKVAIVTGANSGIGKETVRCLAKQGATVIMACRNLEKGQAAMDELKAKEELKGELKLMECDVSSLASVRSFAKAFQGTKLPLNYLVNNAGVMASPFHLTVDGNENQFGTNYLGHFLLTELLLDNLQKSTGTSRVVIVASEAHKFAEYGNPDYEKIQDKDYASPYMFYAYSKLANVLHAKALHEKLSQNKDNTITVNALHPGIFESALQRHGIAPTIANYLFMPIVKNIPQGAATSMAAICVPDLEGGQYLADCNVYVATSQGNDMERARKLRELSEKLVSA